MGILGLLGTLALQLLGIGELKGTMTTLLTEHGKNIEKAHSDIKELQQWDKQQDHEIAEIKGKLHGIASQVGKVPGRVAAKLEEKPVPP